ncbi:MAG: DivIVA domain-containing protein [Deltaproteobacteria bacterium]|nr:DivIVA domain-containing protein [Deltaproteobacteria bacterium]
MKITPIEVKEHKFRKAFRGYDPQEVKAFTEVIAEAIEEAAKYVNNLDGKLKDMTAKLAEHEEREKTLRETITTAQKMVEDLKNNARKEAELIVSEARIQADELIKKAHERVIKVQEELYQLKKQRLEMQTSIKAILEYHTNLLFMEGQGATKEDEQDDKLKFIKK